MWVFIVDVKTLCLGILTLKDASGYDIRQYFEEGPFSHFAQAGYGSIYPALSTALKEDLVTCRAEVQDGRPDKKIYSITPVGRTYLTQQLHRKPVADRFRSDYLVSFLFAGLLEPKHLESIYDEYLQTFTDNVELLSNLSDKGVSPGNAFVRELGIVLYGSIASHLAEHRERFIASIADGLEDTGASELLHGEQV